MKKTSKIKRILSLLLTLCMVLGMVNVPVAHATEEGKTLKMLYLKPSTEWTSDGARFAAYFFGNGDTWVSMSDSNGDGVYEVSAPTGYSSVIFCRMNGGNATNDWSNKWNQTADLVVDEGKNNMCYDISGWDAGSWTPYTPTYIIAGCLDNNDTNGGVFDTAWDAANTANQMELDEEDGLYKKTYTNAPAGDYTLKVTNGTWDVSWGAGGGNYAFNLTGNNNLTITFDPSTQTISHTAVPVFSVAFEMNGHGETIDPVIIVSGEKVSAPTASTATGYTFLGWFTDAACTAAYDFDTPVTADMTLYAKWEVNEHTITFYEEEDGTVLHTITDDYGAAITAPADPERAGYTFAGWLPDVPATMPDEDLDIVAQWVPLGKFSVSFDMNGHGTAITAQTITDGDTAVKPTPDPAATGYTFGGWFTDAACTIPYDFSTPVTANITLYAKWTANQHTVTFLMEENGDVITTITQDYGTDITPPEDPTRDGFIFTGWDSDIPATMPDEDLTFAAQWEELTVVYLLPGSWTTNNSRFAAYFFQNGLDATWKSMTDSDADGIYEVTVPSGYTNIIFCRMNGSNDTNDWNNKLDQTEDLTVPTDDNVYFTVTTNTGEKYTGTWSDSAEPVPPTPLDYYLVGWINNSDYTGTDYKFVDGKLTVTFTTAAYVIVKDSNGTEYWSDGYCGGTTATLQTSGFTGQADKMLAPENMELQYTLVVNDDGTLTLSYVAEKSEAFTVTFNMNGHGNSIDPVPVTDGNKVTKPADPTADGYWFDGWYKDAQCTNAWNFDTDTVTEDITLYAKWTEKVYYVAGNIAEKFPDADHRMTYNAESGLYEKTYTIAPTGRYEIEIIDGNNDTCSRGAATINVTKIADITVKFHESSGSIDYDVTYCFSVSFEMNGHGEALESYPISSGGKVTRPADPTAEGFTFAGWYTNAECSGEPYNFDAEVTADIKLYARWIEKEVVTYTVIFNMNSHGNTIADQIVTEGKMAVAPTAPTAEGYTFGGWYTDADCSGDAYNFDTTVNADITLYAKWTVNQYTITFVTGDGATVIDPITQDYGTAIVAPADPTRDGFTFAGWDMAIPATMPADNLTITAQWTENVPEPEAQVIYFKPSSNWTQANARFAAYVWNDAGNAWFSMVDSDNDGHYEVEISSDYTSVIFVRMNPNSVTNSWDNKWGQTEDLTVPADGANCFTVTDDSGEKATGTWSSYTPPAEPIPVTYVIAGAVTIDGVELGSVFGTTWDPENPDNLMALNEESGLYEKTYTNAPAGSYAFKVTNGSWNLSWGNGEANYTFVLTEVCDFTITFDPETWQIQVLTDGEEVEPARPDYYLVGYINGEDYTGTDYKFEDGKLTVTFAEQSYVYVKDSNGTFYWADGYCTDISAVLKSSGFANKADKMLALANVELEYTLVVNSDGTLTLSYSAKSDLPEIPEDANTVTIHFLRPTNWGGIINAYLWRVTDDGEEKILGVWPGKPIPANEKAGWYDLTVAADEAFNFIFNDGSNQNSQGISTGEITGPTELWVIGEEVYTSAPLEWTSYTVTVHFQKPEGWGDINAYAWLDNGEKLLGAWPGTALSASANAGWYTALMYVKIGQELNIIFNDGSNQTADIALGLMTGNAELWLDGTGTQTARPEGWIDESRTIHLPGTLGGNNWDASGNQLEYDAERGLYTITFEDVIPGTYEYKIAVNGGWGENYGAGGEKDGGNMSVTVTETQDVTFWYSDSSHRVVCSVNYDIDAVVTLSGTGITEGTRLTDTELDGLFTATVYLSAGKYTDLKIVCGEVEVAFHEFIITEGKNVTFSFDPSTGMGYHDGSDLKVDTTHIFYDTKDINYKDPFGAVAVGESVKFSITTGTDATGVSLVVRGVGSIGLEKDGESVNGVQRWTCTYAFESIGEYEYYFSITNGSDMVVYCDDNWNNYYKTGDYGTGGIGNPNDIFAYDIVVHTADFETPDWMKDAVIYQIFPDRFFDAMEYNNDDQTTARGTVDYEYVNDWYMLPENPEMASNPDYPIYALKGDGEWSNEIYGGDLAGITERIEYLKALGVTVIYLNPVFSSISNHRYDACDYMKIDPILGDLGDFEELVAVAEANGMHIILDGVFNHVSDDSVYFDRYYKFLPDAAEKYDGKIGAYPYWAYVYDLMNEEGYSRSAAESAARTYFAENYGITDFSYTEWFAVENKKATYSDSIGLRAGKKVYTYEGWWGYDSMPVIKSTNGSEFQTGNWAEEILSHENPDSVNAYWITRGMDGWRLDVANEVSDETWQNFRESVKALDSEAVIIGEIWADATRYLLGDMYDSVMNYVFRDAVAGFARGYLINRDNKAELWDNDYTASDAITTLEILRERYPEEAFYAMMNLVGSHDTARILSYLDDVEDDRYQKDIANNFPMYETTSERAKQLQYVVAFIQFTYAGAPTIYYGDEIGMTGCDDPDDRRAFEWGKGQKDLVEWYATLAAIRAEYPALRTGSVEPFAPDRDVMGYVRSDAENTLIVLVNRSSSDKTITRDGTYVDLISGETFSGTVTVPAYRGVILVAADEIKNYSIDTEALAPAYDPAYIVPMRDETPPADPEPELETFTVSFNMNGHGDAVETQTITEGEKAAKPADPTAESRRPSGLRKTNVLANSLAHRTTWLRPDFRFLQHERSR